MSTVTQSIPQGKIVLTYDDYCLLPNDSNRYEILDGELFRDAGAAYKTSKCF